MKFIYQAGLILGLALSSFGGTISPGGGTISGGGGSSASSTRLGFVASPTRFPNTLSTSGNTFSTRQCFYASDTITSVSLGYVNCYSGTATVVGGAANVSAAIEYPVGTSTQILFNQQPYGTMADGGLIVSDLTTIPKIPQGAIFYIRTYYTNTVGNFLPYYAVQNGAQTYVSSEFGSNLADKTTNGATIGTPGAVVYYGPVAVIGNTSKRSVLVVGDSRDDGKGDTTNNAPLFGADRWIAPVAGCANLSVGGGTFTSFTSTNFTYWTNFATIFWTDMGINTLGASVISDQNGFYLRFGLPTVVETLSPRTTSSDGWMTVAGQTPASGLASDANRTNFNAAARNHWLSNELACLDVCSITESSLNSGAWTALSSSAITGQTNMTSDGIHGNYHTLIANGLVDPILNPVITIPQYGGGIVSGSVQGNWLGTFSGSSLNETLGSPTVTNQYTLVNIAGGITNTVTVQSGFVSNTISSIYGAFNPMRIDTNGTVTMGTATTNLGNITMGGIASPFSLIQAAGQLSLSANATYLTRFNVNGGNDVTMFKGASFGWDSTSAGTSTLNANDTGFSLVTNLFGNFKGTIKVSTNLVVQGGVIYLTNAVCPFVATNGVSGIWNSNGTATYLRTSLPGQTTFNDQLLKAH